MLVWTLQTYINSQVTPNYIQECLKPPLPCFSPKKASCNCKNQCKASGLHWLRKLRATQKCKKKSMSYDLLRFIAQSNRCIKVHHNLSNWNFVLHCALFRACLEPLDAFTCDMREIQSSQSSQPRRHGLTTLTEVFFFGVLERSRRRLCSSDGNALTSWLEGSTLPSVASNCVTWIGFDGTRWAELGKVCSGWVPPCTIVGRGWNCGNWPAWVGASGTWGQVWKAWIPVLGTTLAACNLSSVWKSEQVLLHKEFDSNCSFCHVFSLLWQSWGRWPLHGLELNGWSSRTFGNALKTCKQNAASARFANIFRPNWVAGSFSKLNHLGLERIDPKLSPLTLKGKAMQQQFCGNSNWTLHLDSEFAISNDFKGSTDCREQEMHWNTFSKDHA